MKEFWLTINPNTFIWLKNGKGIVYNSDNYKSFVFHNSDPINDIYSKLMDIDNLYTVVLDAALLDDKDILNFVENIVTIQAGFLTEKTPTTTKPISLLPKLKIRETINVFKSRKDSDSQTINILKNLNEITIHINGVDNISPLLHKQFVAPSDSADILSIHDVKKFIKKCCAEYITSLNLVGDFSKYRDMELLMEWMNNNEFRHYNLVTNLSSWLSCKDDLKIPYEQSSFSLNIVVDDLNLMERVDSMIDETISTNIQFRFPVSSEMNYRQATKFIEHHKITHFEIMPLFNGYNIDFFKKYVYTSIDDLHLPGFNKREIFANQTINTNFFGKLNVMPNGTVYANLNHDPIGTITDSICNLIFNELDSGKSWLMIRDTGACSDCLYQWMCPSPSNYETVLEKENLCTISV